LVRKGYPPDEVDAFLRRVAAHVDRLQGQLDWQRARSEQLGHQSMKAQEAAYSQIGRDFTEVVRALEEAISRIRAEAEAEARKRIAAAHDEADRIVAAAKEAARNIAPSGKEPPRPARRGPRVVRVPEAQGRDLLSASEEEDR
jgi:cell division septum initiation protein DivIVA